MVEPADGAFAVEHEAVREDPVVANELAWRREVLFTLKGILAGQTLWRAEQRENAVFLERLVRQVVERPELSVEKDPAAVNTDPLESSELGTWILTDENVARIEEAIGVEQRVRGRAYGAT